MEILHLDQLEMLELENNNVESAPIEALINMDQLWSLNLENNPLGFNLTELPSKFLPDRKLAFVNLNDCELVGHLSEAFQN